MILIILVSFTGVIAKTNVGINGSFYMPKGLSSNVKVPVIIVEKGLANSNFSRFAIEIQKNNKVIVIEVNIRALNAVQAKEKVMNALNECNSIQKINECPWFWMGFSAMADTTFNALLLDSKDFQGLISINGPISLTKIPKGLQKENFVPILLINGTSDPVFSIKRAKKLAQDLKKLKLSVTFKEIKTSNHMKPITSGIPAILKFIKSNGKKIKKRELKKIEKLKK